MSGNNNKSFNADTSNNKNSQDNSDDEKNTLFYKQFYKAESTLKRLELRDKTNDFVYQETRCQLYKGAAESG